MNSQNALKLVCKTIPLICLSTTSQSLVRLTGVITNYVENMDE